MRRYVVLCTKKPEPRPGPRREGAKLGRAPLENTVTDGARPAKLVALEERQVILTHLVQVPARVPLSATLALPEALAGVPSRSLGVDERPGASSPRTSVVVHPLAALSVVDAPIEAPGALAQLVGLDSSATARTSTGASTR